MANTNREAFRRLTLAHGSALYSGKWFSTPHSVTVHYRGHEVSISAGGTRQLDMAKALLTELIEREKHGDKRDAA